MTRIYRNGVLQVQSTSRLLDEAKVLRNRIAELERQNEELRKAEAALSKAKRIVEKQRIDPKLSGPGITAHERFLYSELERLHSAVIAAPTSADSKGKKG